MHVYTDQVLDEIGKGIASFEAERGGALLGIPNSNLITDFIEDPSANVTSVSYFPSKELTLKVNNKELHHGLEFKGIIHSHPGNFNIPSGQDENAFALGLLINPRLSGFIAPIVTLTDRHSGHENNELKLSPCGQLTSYVAYREKKSRPASMGLQNQYQKRSLFGSLQKDGLFFEQFVGKTHSSSVIVEKAPCTIMPINSDTNALIDKLQPIMGEVIFSSNGYLEINGVLFISMTYRFQDAEIIIFFPPNYPITKPFVLVSKILYGRKCDAVEILFPWLFSYSGKFQLAESCGNEIINFLR